MLSENRLNRRIHTIPEFIWGALFQNLTSTCKFTNADQTSCVDSFPMPICNNIRIKRCRLYQGKDYQGYIVSNRRYFYGLCIYMIVRGSREPVEFILYLGEENNVSGYKELTFDLPAGATCFADEMSNDCAHEDLLHEAKEIDIQLARKTHSKQRGSSLDERYKQEMRKRVETSFSDITRFFPKRIHAVTPGGLELKIVLFILTFGAQSFA